MFGIWTTVSGGVTGTRSSWLKRDGVPLQYATMAEAQRAAEDCRARYLMQPDCTPSGRPIARQYFIAQALPGTAPSVQLSPSGSAIP